MAKSIETINWFMELEHRKVDKVDNDFLIINKPIFRFLPKYPFKGDVITALICKQGYIKGSVDLKSQTIESPGLAVILPEQLIEIECVSDDFDGFFIIMSKAFTASLNIEHGFSLRRSILDNVYIRLTKNDIKILEAFYWTLKRAIKKEDNPYRLEILKCLNKAFYYSWGYDFHKTNIEKTRSKREQLLDTFLHLVKNNFKQNRTLGFYAGKLSLTPKHLSKVIKESSNKTAMEWIDSYVMMESKVLLKSTTLSIQQISDELNFPSQSFFGKYFKRHAGMSPREYKNKSTE